MNGGLLLAGDDVINSSRAAPEQRCIVGNMAVGQTALLCILSSNGRCEEKSDDKYVFSVEKGDSRADIQPPSISTSAV